MPFCNYPMCHNQQKWIPVVEFPTIRIPEGGGGQPSFCDKPTILLAPEVCEDHRKVYNFLYWFGKKNWFAMQAEAKSRGYVIPEPDFIDVKFKPLGWTPNMRYLEVDRG